MTQTKLHGSMIDSAAGSASAARSAIGLANVDDTADSAKPISTAVQTALDGKQPLDATLTALAAVSTAANKLIYASGSDAFTTADLSAFARTLLDDASASDARTTLGVGVDRQTFDTSGTWTKPSHGTIALIEAWAAGGSGAKHASGGGGGAGGGYDLRIVALSALGATETVTIGTGGAASTTATGAAGGNTSFGSHLTVNGGVGGSNTSGGTGGSQPGAPSPVTGVIDTNADLNLDTVIHEGAGGSTVAAAQNGRHRGGGGGAANGTGGSSVHGGGGGGGGGTAPGTGGTSLSGGAGGAGGNTGNGTDGTQPGGGGGGTRTGTQSGAGGSGRVIITVI